MTPSLDKLISVASTKDNTMELFLKNHPQYIFGSLESSALYWCTVHGVQTGNVTDVSIDLVSMAGETTQGTDEKALLVQELQKLSGPFEQQGSTTEERVVETMGGLLSEITDKIKNSPRFVLLNEKFLTLAQLIHWNEDCVSETLDWEPARLRLASILKKQNPPAVQDSNQEPPPPYESTAPAALGSESSFHGHTNQEVKQIGGKKEQSGSQRAACDLQ